MKTQKKTKIGGEVDLVPALVPALVLVLVPGLFPGLLLFPPGDLPALVLVPVLVLDLLPPGRGDVPLLLGLLFSIIAFFTFYFLLFVHFLNY